MFEALEKAAASGKAEDLEDVWIKTATEQNPGRMRILIFRKETHLNPANRMNLVLRHL